MSHAVPGILVGKDGAELLQPSPYVNAVLHEGCASAAARCPHTAAVRCCSDEVARAQVRRGQQHDHAAA